MNREDLWRGLRHLFENDDGSLPDIYVWNLTDDQIVKIYRWVRTQAEIYDTPTLWSIAERRDVPVADVDDPAREFVERRVETFRHGLENLDVDGVRMPPLTISVEKEGLSFDYRMGRDWGAAEVEALFKFLRTCGLLAPGSRIVQADEGGWQTPNVEFERIFEAYCAEHGQPDV